MNVSYTFQEFLQNLAIDNREKISKRYGEITKVLNIKYRNTESTTSNSLQVGSYGRFTAIKSISDLDMVYILPWTEYERFKNGRQSALLQEVKKTIQSRYPKTDMRGDGQVVVISFTNFIGCDFSAYRIFNFCYCSGYACIYVCAVFKDTVTF